MNNSPVALVVDDEFDLAWALQQTLILDGWRVLVVHTGIDAIARAMLEPICIAFVDAKLPDMDGLDVARQIAALQPATVLILVSGYYYAEDQTVQEVLREGLFAHFISKPFDLTEISTLARESLKAENALHLCG
jgi:DNA-binding NtrC family response regulator